MCVCVRACMRACVHACVRVCVVVYSCGGHGCSLPHIQFPSFIHTQKRNPATHLKVSPPGVLLTLRACWSMYPFEEKKGGWRVLLKRRGEGGYPFEK